MANFVLPEVSFQLLQLFVCYRRVPPSRLRATTAGVLGTVWKGRMGASKCGYFKGKGRARGGAWWSCHATNLKISKLQNKGSGGFVFHLTMLPAVCLFCCVSEVRTLNFNLPSTVLIGKPAEGDGHAGQPPIGRVRSAER